MRVSVDAVLVVRRGGEPLEATLKGLATQTRPVNRVCLVDASADSTLGVEIDAAVEGSNLTLEKLTVPFGTSLAEALDEASIALFPTGSIGKENWLWLLRDDTPPHPDALQQLTVSVEGAPLVQIAGPKQRMMDRPRVIREMGETMTQFGERIALAERELDQAQYDRLSDVLGVGEVGMMVNANTLVDLEGFDTALTPLDGGLDLCVRARLAGHRVVVVPRAVVEVAAGPADWHAGKKVSGGQQHYLARRSWLYRRLAYATPWTLFALLAWVAPWAIIRGVFSVVTKHPERLMGELAAGVWALLRLPDVFRARAVIRRTRVTSFATIDSLRMPLQDVRKRKAIASEALLADREEKALATSRPAFFPAVPWLLLTLVVASGLLHGRWWGSEVLLGGGVLPLSSTFDELWAGVWGTTWVTHGLGAPSIPADPAQLIFALLGSLTWWQPSLALVVLLVVAIPLAGWSAWWGLSQVLSKAWTTALLAGVWAIAPTFLIGIQDGRIGAVIAHITLPWLVGSLLTAHESWQRVGQASLATVILLGAAPVLWPAVTVGYLVVGLARVWSHGFRMFVGVLPLGLAPAALLALPRLGAWWESVSGPWWQGLGVVFADPGLAVSYQKAPWWMMAAGWPSLPESLQTAVAGMGVTATGLSWFLVACATPIVLLALASLVVGRPTAGATFATMFSVGLITAVSAPGLFMGYEDFTEVFVWAGTGISVMFFGLILGAGASLDRAEFHDAVGNAIGGVPQWLTRVSAGVVVVAVSFPLIPQALATWDGQTFVQPATTWRTLPAFVAAEAIDQPMVGTLIIEQTPDGFQVELERGGGRELSLESTLIRGRTLEVSDRDTDLATLAATLVRPSAFDPKDLLQEYGIRFIVITAPEGSDAILALANRPELVSASSGENGDLWQVPDVSLTQAPSHPKAPALPQQLALGLLALVGLLALPTERKAKPGPRVMDDALPTLGEDTSDDL
jgi:GT2 family glycosyltransferase